MRKPLEFNKNLQLSDLVNMYSTWIKKHYGQRVFRVGVSTGQTCPHRAAGGCIFCNPVSFRGDYQSQNLSVEEQLAKGIQIIRQNCGVESFIAYFQDETSTAGDLEYLRNLFERAAAYKGVVGLVVSTRPDYVNKEVCQMLKELDAKVEIGLQTVHEKSLSFLRRGHNQTQSKKALDLCNDYGIDCGVHLMMGIPGESFQDMLATVKWVSNRSEIREVKFHNLVVYDHTELAELWRRGQMQQMPVEEYVKILADLLPYLRQDIVVSRLFTSNILHNDLSLEKQKGNKTRWMNELRLELIKKEKYQGIDYEQ